MTGEMAGWALENIALKIATVIFLKGGVLVAVAFATTLMLRRESASVRHATWGIALLLLATMPVLAAILPSWRPPLHLLAHPGPDGIQASRTAARGLGSAGRHPHGLPATDDGQSGSRSPLRTSDRIALGLVVLWLSGTAALGSRVALHAASVRAIARRGIPLRDDAASALVAAAGVGRKPMLVLSDEVTQPFAYGALTPLIVCPAGSEHWPWPCRRSIILHELAHIVRGDWLLHLVGECVRALYWPNPLVWYALRRYAAERERSCDDFALRMGTRGAEYASHLLAVARGQLGAWASVNSMAVDGRSGLVERTRSLLNHRLERTPVSGPTVAFAGACALAFALPLVALDVVGQPRRVPTTENLVRQLSRDGRPESRRLAAWWLGEHEDTRSVGPLLVALKDPSGGVRQAAAWALGEIKDRRAIDPLTEALGDESPLVREMAALALGEIEHPSAVKALSRASEDATLRPAVAWALGQIPGRAASEARHRVLGLDGRRPRPDEELFAGPPGPQDLGLGAQAWGDDVPALIERLGSDGVSARQRAALRIGVLGQQGRLDTWTPVVPLLELLSDPAPEVRAAAIWSLDEINPSRWEDEQSR